ncbi:MAG: hypothetical protein R3B06_12980 [Kofleriaceae bacterium]
MALAQARVIRGAVATLGVSDRVAFLRRTYAHLGVALVAWTALTAGIMQTEWSLRMSAAMLSGGGSWLLVMGAFMLVGWGAQRLAQSPSSRGLQYLGLAIFVVAEALILQPLLWVAYLTSKSGADFQASSSNRRAHGHHLRGADRDGVHHQKDRSCAGPW